ncbi:MAG: S-layer homology domain-containing protein, partial [Flexilinea sp.]|nr:S-layer homology domain-containing protein [Flexilinea sp.]
MKKQILFLMLALLLMLSVFPAFAEGPDSSAAEILQAQENHLIPHTLIGEDLTRGLTHAELSSLAVRLYSALNPAAHIIPENTHYANVTGHRLQSEMEFAYGLGFLADMGGEYYPDYLVTRQQTAQMLCMVLKSFVYSDWTPERDSRYFLDYNMKFRFADDRDIDSSMADSVYFLAANGIMPGMNDEMFCPGDVISRASAIISANRLFLTYRNMAPSGDRPSGPATDVTDPTNGIPGQTTGTTDQTTGLPSQTTGTTDQTTSLPGQTTGTADQTTGMPGQTTGTTDQTIGIPGQTPGTADQTTGISGQTPDAADQTNGLPGQTTDVIDQITEGGNKKSKVTEQTIEAADPQEEMAALMSRKFSAYYKRFGLVKSDGSLWTWGEKYLGNGERGGSNEPVHIMDDVDAVYMGQEASLAIKTDGTLWAWGNNYGRTIGNGQDGGEQLTPVKILDNVVTASMGSYTAAAVTGDGGLYIWGHNSDGNLADTIPSLGGIGQYLTPTRIMEGVADVSCNNANYGAFTMVLKQDGTLWTFGA